MFKTCAAFLAVLVFRDVYGQTVYRETPTIFDTSNIANGVYHYSFKTPEAIERYESGGFDNKGEYVVRGFYSYINDRNQRVAYGYVADKDGYRTVPSSSTIGGASAGFSGRFDAPAPTPPNVLYSLLG